MMAFSIPVHKVIDHRELNELAEKNIIYSRYRTSEFCPGKKIYINFISVKSPQSIAIADHEISDVDVETRLAMNNAISVLQKHRAQFPNAQDELDEFVHHPEIIAMPQ
ncbi:MAG: N-acetylmuramoyl-L-alanine amidase [Psychroserpens sp.]|jgi:N-acetylmuramoyl-L-alanine amidase